MVYGMRTVCVLNQKGGQGKTTTSVNLAATLVEKGYRVLVIDLDGQAHASKWLGVADGGRGLLDALAGETDLATLVRPTESGVDIIPSSTWLYGAERLLATQPGAECCLREAIQTLPNLWDIILIDNNPSLGLLSVSALVAAHGVLVPVETQTMATDGLASLMKTIERVKQRLNPSLQLDGILPFRYRSSTNLASDVIESLTSTFGARVFRTPIRENVRLAEAFSFQQPITTYAAKSAGAADYRAVAVEAIQRWSLKEDSKCAA